MIGRSVIVVGAGFGGIGAASLLAKNGFRVRVIEKNEQAGGRASVWRERGFTFDMGPSWYLMPDVFSRYFEEFGKSPEDYMNLVRLDPAYRVFFSEDEVVDLSPDLEKNKYLFERMEEGASVRLEEYLSNARQQYEVAMRDFIYQDFEHLKDFLRPRLVLEGIKLNLLVKLDDYVKRFFSSDKIKKILEYTTVFLGGSPYESPALYCLLSHVDFDLGVWFPRDGGIGKLVEAMLNVAFSEGVEFEFNNTVTRIIVKDSVVRGVGTENGDRTADIVIINADYAYSETTLLEERHISYPERYWKRKKIASSGFIIYLGLNKRIESLAHHNLYFHPQWERHFRDIFHEPRWPESPSYYVSCTSKTDTTVAPEGCENIFIFVPVAAGLADTDEIRVGYSDKIIRHLEKLTGESIMDSILVKRVFSHRDFSERYNAYQGTALGLAHTLRQTAIFRPSHESRKVRNLYYTGHYTHPGIGIPMVLISSQILAKKISSKTL